MTAPCPSKHLVSLASLAGLAALALAGAPACEDPDVFIPRQEFGGPAGVLEGTVTYTGPAPCVRKDGRIVGAAAILAFDTSLLPPPEGLGTTAASLDIVSGDELFAGVRNQLVSNPENCGTPMAQTITVSATWTIAPLPAGTYQIRGFYDLDGDFDPAFSISNLPTRGDVGGGAILNAAEVLTGGAPRYREISLGVNGQIPPEGARIGGIAVTFGLPLPLERPVFHVAEVLDPRGASTDPNNAVMPSDYLLPNVALDTAFFRLRLAGGVLPGEASAAVKSPFLFPVAGDGAATLHYARQDVNGDGLYNEADHIPESDKIPALFPLSIFEKLEGSSMASQSAPRVIIQGLTIYQDLLTTGGFLTSDITMPDQPEVMVAVRPAALCLPADPTKPGVLVVSHKEAGNGAPVIPDEAALKAAMLKQFRRPIDIEYGCLPEGRYATNLVYPTGQAWTVPNEAGVCGSDEAPGKGTCGSRARLDSQNAVLTIGPPADPGYCTATPTPPRCLPTP